MPKVLIAVETWWGNGRKVIDGITRYVEHHASWTYLYGMLPDLRPSTIQHFAPLCDGMIVEAWRGEIIEATRSAGKPTVLVYPGEGCEDYVRVRDDSAAIATQAFEHFRGRGFKHFAYCGNPATGFSGERHRVFAQHIEQINATCHAYQSRIDWLNPAAWTTIHRQIGDWAKSLPKPIAMFCANSHLGRLVVAACRGAGLLVPEDVAVLGVSDDEIVCNVCNPPLSAVDSAGEEIGYEAARLMQAMLKGKQVPPELHLVAPRGVVVRRSTDTLALDDPDLIAALRLIREQSCEGLRVSDLLQAIPCSRRKLERGFKQYLGRSLHQEILRVRVEHAKLLLTTSDLSMPEISVRCGFEYATHLAAVFKRLEKHTPDEYRKNFRHDAWRSWRSD